MTAGRPTDDRDDADDPAIILDPEDYSQHRRLQELYNLREEIQDTRQRMELLRVEGKASRKEANEMYLTALKGYLMELEPLALRQYPEAGDRYWHNADLPSAVYHPEADIFYDPPGDRGIGTTDPPAPKVVEFDGLADIVNADTPVHVTFEQEKAPKHRTSETVTKTEKRAIPKPVLDATFRQANLFLADIGMDLDPERDDGPGTFDLDEFV